MPSQLDSLPPWEVPVIDRATGKFAVAWRPWFSRLAQLVQFGSENWTTANRPTTDLYVNRWGFNTTLGSLDMWDGSAWLTLGVDTTGGLPTTLIAGWNGSLSPNPVIVVSSNGTQWTMTLTGTGTTDLECIFDSVEYTFDGTPAASINLTAGTDTAPQANYIYLTESGGTVSLNLSTSGFPAAEAIIFIAECTLQSAASGQTHGAYEVHQHSEHLADAFEGMIVHHSEKLRELGATWFSGVAAADLVISSPDAYISVSAGVVHQLHSHAFPAIDMQTPKTVYVVNDPTTAFKPITSLDDITQDALGGAIDGRHFSLVLWGSANANGEGQLFINLPTGTYTTAAKSARDAEKYAVYAIPSAFKGTSFEIAEYQVEGKNSGAWVQDAKVDLRGLVPSTSPGGGPGLTDHGDLAGLTDDDHTQYILKTGGAMTGAFTQADAAAVPVIQLEQLDVSEEMLEFISTIGVGNALEAVGGKSLTVTHFIKVTLPGGLTRYIQVGTIA